MLELGLELQLLESVNGLGDVDVVAVGDVALVGDTLDDAEALLQALGKLVGGRLQRGAVEGVVDVLGGLPLLALLVHLLHDGQGEGGGGGIGVTLTGHVLHALVQARVAQGDGGVAAVEELVNGLTLFKPRQSAVLPQDGGGVGNGAQQAVVAAAQGPVA